MMGKIKLHFAYRHVEGPWGGANNFVRALNQFISNSPDFELVATTDQKFDILFMNQLGAGPGGGKKHWNLGEIRALIAEQQCKLVVRAVNVKMKVRLEGGLRTLVNDYLQDRKVLKLLNQADMVIFQSQYQFDMFRSAGFLGESYKIIHNGADPAYWVEKPHYSALSGKLKLVSSSFSDRAFKRHDLIAAISELPDVEVVHVGNWPRSVGLGKVVQAGVLRQEEMRSLMEGCHYLLHPAYLDACPNSVVEALNMGLPVIYNPAPGSTGELVADAGVALDENDLSGTLATARRELELLRENVLRRRERYRMSAVAESYMAAFKSVM